MGPSMVCHLCWGFNCCDLLSCLMLILFLFSWIDKKNEDMIQYLNFVTYASFLGDLKRICETDLGLITQCCLSKHVFKISKQYLANVSLKINVKVRSTLWFMKIAMLYKCLKHLWSYEVTLVMFYIYKTTRVLSDVLELQWNACI